MTLQFAFETATERQARIEYENALIEVYVPEAVDLTREDALKLAYDRDLLAALELRNDVIMLQGLETTVSRL